MNQAGNAAELSWPEPGIALLTLVRGETHNTLTLELLETLHRLVDEATTGSARALILTGSGPTFCGGAHIKLFTEPNSPFYRDAAAVRDQYVRPVIDAFRRFRDAPFPTIAAINGYALGGGCELALHCDFRLMADHGRIGLPEVRLGAVAGAGGVQSIARVVGRAKALEIALFGDQLSADEARSAGLVSAVHPAAELQDAALNFARRLLKCSPIAIAQTKQAIYGCDTAEPDEAERIGLDAVHAAAGGAEWWEGMAAFAERRPPEFQKVRS